MSGLTLYTTDSSPFGARVKIQIYAKDLPVEILPPPGGLGSDALERINPLRKIPVLDTGGAFIAESEVIQEYLEDTWPEPSLRGESPGMTARVRMLSRVADLYLVPALMPLRSLLKAEDKHRDRLDEGMLELEKIFGVIEDTMTGGAFAVCDRLSLADCALAPLFSYIVHFAGVAEIDLSLTQYSRLSAWLDDVRENSAVDRALTEIESSR